MEKVLELRLTKTEYERLLRYALIGNFIETFDKEDLNEREAKLLRLMMIVADMNGLDLVAPQRLGPPEPAEKLIVKMEKILAKYDRFVLERAKAKKK